MPIIAWYVCVYWVYSTACFYLNIYTCILDVMNRIYGDGEKFRGSDLVNVPSYWLDWGMGMLQSGTIAFGCNTEAVWDENAWLWEKIQVCRWNDSIKTYGLINGWYSGQVVG